MKQYLILALSVFLVACKPSSETFSGYVEGEFVFVAPTTGGLLKSLFVERGQAVEAGDPLFSLDLTELSAAREVAISNVERARSELEDLMKGERPEAMEILVQQKRQAEALLIYAQQEYDRVWPLSEVGDVSLSERDQAQAAQAEALARVAEARARIREADLGGRVDRVHAARATLEGAEHALTQAHKRERDAAPGAPQAGSVEDTFFRPGEYVAPGQPVVSVLPPEYIKVRFFVPQAMVPKLRLGQEVAVRCDGSEEPFVAKIAYIAPRAEYTPPVIYSVESREKLVFLIEAKPVEYTRALRPGLPVSVEVKG